MLWVLKRNVSMRRFFEDPKHILNLMGKKIYVWIYNFMLKNCVYLNICTVPYLNIENGVDPVQSLISIHTFFQSDDKIHSNNKIKVFCLTKILTQNQFIIL